MEQLVLLASPLAVVRFSNPDEEPVLCAPTLAFDARPSLLPAPSKGSFPSPPSSLVAFVASARTRMILRAGERRITRERFLVGRALTRENARASSARAVDVAPTRVTSPRGALERIVSEGETSSVDEGAGTRVGT